MKYRPLPGSRPRQVFTQYVDWAGETCMTADLVIESDRSPQPTGLLDQHGETLYRLHETVPFGFRGRRP